jgi:protein subunit release factor A
MKVLHVRLYDAKLQETQAKYVAQARSQVSSVAPDHGVDIPAYR